MYCYKIIVENNWRSNLVAKKISMDFHTNKI